MIPRTRVSAVLAMIVAASTLLLAAQASPPASVVTRTEARTATEVPELEGTVVAMYDAFDATQAVAVDGRYFYAIDTRTITKHDRRTGEPLLQFAGTADGPIEHLDSGVVVNGQLYAAHSNYPERPMESSIEVFDTKTMTHIDAHSFGIYRGSLTWLDRHDGAWWATFANYDKVQEGQTEPYGGTYNTQVVEMDDNFRVVQSWTIPKTILDTFQPMSNSGGSWGPDGRLYLTGHDRAEAHVMKIPPAGGELEWVATISLPGIEGQGIAWGDAPSRPTLWGLSRQNSKVVSFEVPFKDIEDPQTSYWEVLDPGEFQR